MEKFRRELTTFIYALICPRLGRVRYVGNTRNPHVRLQGHLQDARTHKENSHKARWIRGLLQEGKQPILYILESCPVALGDIRERFWEDWFVSQKAPLTNTRHCGGGPFLQPWPEDTHEKMTSLHRERLKELWSDPEYREQMSQNSRGRKPVVTSESRRKRGQASLRYYEDLREKGIEPPWSKLYEGFIPPGEKEPIPPFRNLQRFAREHGLNPQCLDCVYRGLVRNHKGWTNCRPEAIEAWERRQKERAQKPSSKSEETRERMRAAQKRRFGGGSGSTA